MQSRSHHLSERVHDFHDSEFNHSYYSNYSKDYNSYNSSTDSSISSRNLKTVVVESKYVVYNDTILWNQDSITSQ